MFEDGIAAAVHLLSTRAPATLGECSASALVPVGGPTASAQIYIDALLSIHREGSFADGIETAIDLLEDWQVARVKGGWGLVEIYLPSVDNQLFIAELQRLLADDARIESMGGEDA
jgi:hypothetical protein